MQIKLNIGVVVLKETAEEAVVTMVVLVLAEPLARGLSLVLHEPDHLVVGAHIAFNLALVIVGLPLAGIVHRLVSGALNAMQPQEPSGSRVMSFGVKGTCPSDFSTTG